MSHDDEIGKPNRSGFTPSRRDVIDGTGLLGLGLFLGLISPASAEQMPGMAMPAAAPKPMLTTAAQMPGRIFFTDQEATLVEALTARLIPSEGEGPGAIEAGVPNYIDKALGGAWGAGENLYMGGPFKPDAIPELGYQLPYTPAQLFRRALGALENHFSSSGQSFQSMTPEVQDIFIKEQLEGGALGDLDGVPAKEFFAQMMQYTIEGYFCDPAYGGNKDMVAWKAIGFPGAYDAYANTVGRHGEAFKLGPYSLLDHDAIPVTDMVSMEQQK